MSFDSVSANGSPIEEGDCSDGNETSGISGETSGDTGDTGDTGSDTSGDSGGDSGTTTGGDTGDTGGDTSGDSGETSGDTGDTSDDPEPPDPCEEGGETAGDTGDTGDTSDEPPPPPVPDGNGNCPDGYFEYNGNCMDIPDGDDLECPEGQMPRRSDSICVPWECQSCFDDLYYQCRAGANSPTPQAGSTDECAQLVDDCCPVEPDPSGLGCSDQGGVWYCDDDPSYDPDDEPDDPCADDGGTDAGTDSGETAGDTAGDDGGDPPPEEPPECSADSECAASHPDCVALCSDGECHQVCPFVDPDTNCQNFPCERSFCGADDCGGCCPTGSSSSAPKPPSSASPSSVPPSSSSTSPSSTPSSPSSSASSQPSSPSSSSSSSPEPGFCCENGFCSHCDGGGPLNQCRASCEPGCDRAPVCPEPEAGCRYDTEAEVECGGCAPMICDECDAEFDLDACPDPQSQLPEGASNYTGEFICNVSSIPKCGCPIVECTINVSYCCNLQTGQCDRDTEMTGDAYGSCVSAAGPRLYVLPEDYEDLANEFEDLGDGFHVKKYEDPPEEGPSAAESCAESCVATDDPRSSSVAFTSVSSSESSFALSAGTSFSAFASFDFSIFNSFSAPATSSSQSSSVGSVAQSSSSLVLSLGNISSSSRGGAVCGDGAVNQSFEQCDDGNVRDSDGCDSVCQTEGSDAPNRPRRPRSPGSLVCGDGALQVGEQCDDNNTLSGDGCDARCRLESGTAPACGDTILTIGEECDYSSQNSNQPNFCRPDCTQPFCGDGITDDRMNEECDDGNISGGDGCSASCAIEEDIRLVAAASVCGDGVLSVGEECDDGNARGSDGCSESCLLEIGICGDGIVQTLLGEQCESNTPLPGDMRCERCVFVSDSCGDGTVNPGEECDLGAKNSDLPDANCRSDCRYGRCGDYITDTNEECDDGNRVSGDGCDRFCSLETAVLAATEQEEARVDSNSSTIAFPQNQLPPLSKQQYQLGGQPYATPGSAYQLPLAQLQPLIQSRGPVGDTGPAAVAVVGAGAAAGFSWIRRRKK